ncbi:MAG: sensor histidine kinase [Gallionella sp.]|nr:sensor histidine kinase [Gallionella sp.]
MLTLNIGNRLRAGRWLLLAMLLVLHGVLLVGVNSPWAHPLMLAHLGLFLIWQPLWRGDGQVSVRALVFIAVAALVVVFYLNWWVMAFWLIGLFGLVGGRVLAYRSIWARVFSLTQMVYLLTLLLLWVVPNLFAAEHSIEIGRLLLSYVLPVLLPALLLLPADDRGAETTQTIDFFYSLLLFMLLALVVLGCLAFMTLAHVDYLDALLRTLFLMGLILLAMGGLWNPLFGFNGLQVVFSRYLLNIGTPFENWLMRLADAAQHEPDAESYLASAMLLLVDLHWLSGLSWQTPGKAGQLGQFSPHAVVMHEADLRLTVYAKQALSPTVTMHLRLLSQLVGYFYQAKQREQSLRDITRMQTVYETGSRLTHDLKNMLQSLLSLTVIAQSGEARAQQLLQQQLPSLTRRIEQTLSKLQLPPTEDSDASMLPLSAWWDGLHQRNQHLQIAWHAPQEISDQYIPAALFDCVLDNLLDNALHKRQLQPDLLVKVELRCAGALSISVCDSGSPVPANTLPNLLQSVVVSQQGLGIGLYQAAKWAAQLGYRLELTCNQNGKVCFELRG